MIIEWLKFRIAPQLREKFIEKDAEIWTPVLASSPGFLSKEVWISPDAADEVIFVIRWETLQHWQSVTQTLLDDAEAYFAKHMGDDQYEMIEASEYHVRKFPN